MHYLPAVILAAIAYGGPGRRFLRSFDTFEYATKIDCSTAVSISLTEADGETCVSNCVNSKSCSQVGSGGAEGFNVGNWRRCLLDLGQYCAFSPEIYYGQPVVQSKRYTATNNNITIATITKQGTGISASFRWRVPDNLVDECSKRLYSMTCSKNPDQTDLSPLVVHDWKNLSYLFIKTEPVETLCASPWSILDSTYDNESSTSCFIFPDLEPLQAFGQMYKTPHQIVGMRKTKLLLDLDSRGEYYIGATPLDGYDS
ncbi:hypothetical protein GNI_006840 [Gregarina niphandrodes]|uniref:Uncharacterized protein n=1 Tax=Gregarina niphandrodes TaxID=110365 RepID=A0A023BDB0_GRENI|nr:hypothetical protein GNI_006840 [Gregarina niphandrodes]EZG87446.1 hypothetical protein GNI_006840 [Gregarina niphandrodes]|eukprot:XP_011128651.1 hypothetical protein GNI_006840 [Gregarina niphandrodes]